jgi:hypothetical protein
MMALGLGACASTPAVDTRAALLAPCANKADDKPWKITATWADGDFYELASVFRADGVLAYRYTNRDDDREFANGRWSVDGASLHFDMNDHYADYDGAFDGSTGAGRMKNVADNKGEWKLARDCNG